MIPVQIVPTTVDGPSGPQHAMCGTCTKCGLAATAVVSQSKKDGTPRVRLYAAQRAVLEKLTEACPEELPWEIPPHHYDRDIPAGCEVYLIDARGLWLPCHVEKVGKAAVRVKALFTIYGGVQPGGRVVVRPSEEKYRLAAGEYAERLRDVFGLPLARSVAPECEPVLARSLARKVE